jgi:SRSO17 transposase
VDLQKAFEATVPSMLEAADWAQHTQDELMDRLAPVFARPEPRAQAGKYIDGLRADLPRKNGWSLAEHAGDYTPDRMQRLLNHARWDEQAALDVVAGFVVDRLHDEFSVTVFDESGQQKKGEDTAGVKRQYVGCAGRVANAVNVVYATYATPGGHGLVAARPYLPKDWAEDAKRRERAGVPPEVEFRTKPQLALDLATELHAAGRLAPWVTGDEVYGRDPALRTFCEREGVGYVLEVPCSFRITLTSGRKTRADKALMLLEPKGWNHRSAGPGSKGERDYLWAWVGTTSPRHHMLIRRNIHKPTDLAYFYSYVPEGRPITLPTLVRVAGMRWPVEEDFQTGKGHFGLDQSQVRLYPALLRHLVLSIIVLAICSCTAAAMRPRTSTLPRPPAHPNETPPEDPGLIALTVAEIKRLLNLVTRVQLPEKFHQWWVWWRRRHQARARWFHQRTRLRQDAEPS